MISRRLGAANDGEASRVVAAVVVIVIAAAVRRTPNDCTLQLQRHCNCNCIGQSRRDRDLLQQQEESEKPALDVVRVYNIIILYNALQVMIIDEYCLTSVASTLKVSYT